MDVNASLSNLRGRFTMNQGTTTMDGTEQTLYENTSSPVCFSSCVHCKDVAGPDSITLKQYVKVVTGGDYVELVDKRVTVTAATTQLAVNILAAHPLRCVAWKITAEQTAGTNRDLDWNFVTSIQ